MLCNSFMPGESTPLVVPHNRIPGMISRVEKKPVWADHILDMSTDKIAALRQTALFGGLADAELQALAARSVERRIAREETLFVVGEEARGLYVIVSGAVRAFRAGSDGREQVIVPRRAVPTASDLMARP